MLPFLVLLFTVVPAIEIGLFVVVGGRIGPVATVGVVIFTGVAGAALARSQGIRVLARIRTALDAGQMPADELVEAALVLAGGILLITPGFLTDLTGISCLLPPVRKVWAALLKRWLLRRIGAGARHDAGGWRLWTGGVQPGPGSARVDPLDQEPPSSRSPRTIDATFSVVGGEDAAEPAGPEDQGGSGR